MCWGLAEFKASAFENLGPSLSTGDKICRGLKHYILFAGDRIKIFFDFCFFPSLGVIIEHDVLVPSVTFSALRLRGLLRLFLGCFLAIDESVSRLMEPYARRLLSLAYFSSSLGLLVKSTKMT